MPTISVYLCKEFYDKVQGDPSKIIQKALKSYFEKNYNTISENLQEFYDNVKKLVRNQGRTSMISIDLIENLIVKHGENNGTT